MVVQRPASRIGSLTVQGVEDTALTWLRKDVVVSSGRERRLPLVEIFEVQISKG
jgi:hypothetical protein